MIDFTSFIYALKVFEKAQNLPFNNKKNFRNEIGKILLVIY